MSERSMVTPATENYFKSTIPDHWDRYEFATNYVKDKVVVDIACGAGYGTAILSKASGKRAIGLDIDKGAVESASQHYGNIANFNKIDDYNWPLE